MFASFCVLCMYVCVFAYIKKGTVVFVLN
jgi:hypothetical protein